jgi:hypothetical protein
MVYASRDMDFVSESAAMEDYEDEASEQSMEDYM